MRRIDVALQGVAFRSDAAAVQRGRYLYASRGCAFIAMLRTGQRPDGSALSPVMPFNAPKQINHIGAQALYLHLKNLPPVAAGRR